MAKTIIANINSNRKQDIENSDHVPEPPLYPDEELYGVVGDNLKKNYNVREVFLSVGFILNNYYTLFKLFYLGYC